MRSVGAWNNPYQVSLKDHHGHNFPAGKADKGSQGFSGKNYYHVAKVFAGTSQLLKKE